MLNRSTSAGVTVDEKNLTPNPFPSGKGNQREGGDKKIGTGRARTDVQVFEFQFFRRK